MNQACVCDRCSRVYGVDAKAWPGKGLCAVCDLSVPVWQRLHAPLREAS